MLLGENFSGRHEGGLRLVLGGADGREGGHHGLAAADITLQQPQHGAGLSEVEQHFAHDAPLGAGQLEAELFKQHSAKLLRLRQRRRLLALALALPKAHHQVVGSQLVAGDAFLGLGDVLARRAGMRKVEEEQGLQRQGRALRPVQGPDLGNHGAQAGLSEPLGGRIDRGEASLQLGWRFGVVTIFGMGHLHPRRPSANLAEATGDAADLQVLHLSLAEVEEA